MTDTEHIIGIDLGTTNSVVAILEDDHPRVLINSEGSTRTPSVICILENGDVQVGELARRQAAINPSRTITSIKRLMGQTLEDVAPLRDRLSFALTANDGNLYVQVGEQGYTPAQLSAYILRKLKQAAEDYVGESVTKAIITVPAYFDDVQRQETMDAGRLAGLEVLRLINEPTAAAMAYGLGRTTQERVAVFDFGGGTFDVTILDIDNNAFEVQTSLGDTQLGGDDIDDLVINYLLTQFRRVAGEDYTPDAMALRRMREAAEKAKCDLSVTNQSLIQLPFLSQIDNTPLHLEVTLDRDTLEELMEPLIERTIDICERALEDCGLEVNEIDRVLLVGGSTRIPLVQSAVADFFGIAPFKGLNPDEIVAMGAATQAGVLAGKLKEVILLDVTPHSLGVEVADNRISRIIEKNSTIPIKAARLFTTTDDNQEIVQVHVVQGEEEKAAENRSLGRFTLTGIQPARAGVPRIQVVFHINADGMVEVLAEDMATREQVTMNLSISPEDSGTGSADGTASRRRAQMRRRKPRKGRKSSSSTQDASEIIVPRSPAGGKGRPGQSFPIGGGGQPSFHTLAPMHPGEEMTPVQLRTVEQPVASVAPAAKGSPVAETPVAKTVDQPPPSLPPSETQPRAEVPVPVAKKPRPQLASAPKNLSDLSRQALDYVRKGIASATALTTCVRAYQELVDYATANPDDADVLEQTVKLLVQINEPDLASHLLSHVETAKALSGEQLASLYDLYLAKFPDDEIAITNRAWVLASTGLVDVAIADFERVCSDERGTDAQVEQLIILYNNKLSTRDDHSIRFKLVKLLVRRGRVDEAINLLQQLINIDSYHQRSLQALGFCFWQKGMHYLAWQKFQQLPLNDELRDILYRLASDMEDTEQMLNAKSVWQHLAESDSGYRDVQARLRKCELSLRAQGPPASGPEHDSVPVGFRNSRFTILEETNRGSMGIVYRAKDKVLDEIVALKVLNDYMTSDPRAVERFKREARAARKLSHHNIVRIHDMYEFGTKRLISMEFIEGRDLKAILHQRKVLPAQEIIPIIMSVCDALAYAHQLGIVHRDVKPANVMINVKDEVKVTDFGIAKFILSGSPEQTRSGSQILGTPLYMSPEQIRGEQIDVRTDIYSIGAMLYEMTSGRPPFHDGNIEYHHLHTVPAPMPETVPLKLAEIIARCLEKEPDNRYADVPALQADLKTVL